MTRRPTVPAVKPGDVLVIGEADYCYGVGELVLQVAAADPNPPPGLEWIRIIGTHLRWDGTRGDRRDVLVRVTALPTAIRAGTTHQGGGHDQPS